MSSTPLSSGPRQFPRLKFVWGSSKVIHARWRLGLWGFYERVHGFPGSGLAVSVRGFLRWTVVLLVLGYLGGAFALTRFLARNPHNQLRYTDVLTWPVRRAHVAQIRAQGWIAQGTAAMGSQRWADAVFYLRRGLDIRPGDFEARFLLAQFYVLTGDRTRALGLAVEGLEHGLPPRSRLEDQFNLAAAGEDWTTTLLLCERALPQLSRTEQWGYRQWVLSRKLAALIALDRAAEALALAEAEGDTADVPVAVQRGRALLALRRPADAAALLARWPVPANLPEASSLLRQRAAACREAGQFDEMERTLATLRTLKSSDPNPLVWAIEERVRAGRGAAAAVDEYIFRFGGTAANLTLAAQTLAKIPDVGLLQRIIAAAREQGYPMGPYRVQLAEAQVRQGNIPDFLRTVAELRTEFGQTRGVQRLWYDWVDALAESLAAPSTAGAGSIVAFVQTHLISLEAHRLTIDALRRIGREEIAREVLPFSRRLYAESPWLIAQQADLARILAATPATPGVTLPAAPTVATDWETYARDLDAAMAAARWPEARQLVRDARQARPEPSWLTAHQSDIAWRELRIAHALKDRSALQLATVIYVNGDLNRAAAVLNLAREWHAADASDDAIFLAKAVLEKSPNHNVARGLIAQWQPKPGEKQ